MRIRHLIITTLIFLAGVGLRAQAPVVQQAILSDVSIPLRDMKPVLKSNNASGNPEIEEEHEVPNKFWPVIPGNGLDAALQTIYQYPTGDAPATAPLINFAGIANSANGASLVTPPDPAGDVGPNNYVEVANSMLQIYNKSGGSLYGPVKTSTLWDGFNGNWTGHNNGDGIVLYDETADRWIISQFAIKCGTYPNYTQYEMVAVSTTGDPTGPYYRFAFQFDYMPDYPKLGVWQDGYYMAINRFNTNASGTPWVGAAGCVMERSKMLTGDVTAKLIYFKTETLGGSGSAAGAACQAMLPSDCDGTLPAAGTPNYFVYMNGSSELRLWALHPDWITTANSTFTFVTALPVTPYTETGSIPEQGSLALDGLGDRLMFRNQYRNFGSYETFVTCHSVISGSVTGVRWYEYRKTGSTFSLYQQSTYSPADGKYRWMGSIAMNAMGDIGLAYSVSSSTMFPSIYFTGRKASDPINQMTIAEGLIHTGTVSMTTYSRWGDYTAMNVDPSDNITFWTTQEFVGTYGGWCPWATKIASFKFPSPPIIVTLPATAITTTAATLNGTINPGGQSSSYHYEWGTTTGYGNSTTSLSAGSGTTVINVNAGISGLTAGTTYHYRLVGTNSDGTVNGSDGIFTTVCSTYGPPFTESYSNVTIPNCWSQVDHQGNGQLWQFGTITGSGVPVLSGNYAYLNSNGYGSGNSQNADLISPIIDLSIYASVYLKFNHYFRVKTASTATLSYSIDNGANWTQIQQWTASTANPASFNQVITGVGGQSQVRFKWNFSGSNEYYWAIDDITISVNGLWIGGTSGTPQDWNIAANWDGGVPTATTDVYIPARAYLPFISTSGTACRNLVIGSGASLTINPTFNLTVNGTTTIY